MPDAPLHDAQLLALTFSRRRFALAVALVALLGAFVLSLFVTFFQAEILDQPRAAQAASRRIAERLLLVVIDGLRADTAFKSGCMPRLQRIAGEHTSGIAWATAITMTGVGIKALGGGVSSGLWSIARNWDQPHATFDNLFDRLRQRGGRIALVGNPTWAALYGPATEIDPQRRRMTDLFHLIDPVYGDDLVWARYARQVVATDGWDLAIVHLGGIDNASHIWTPLSPLFCDKARTMDRDVAAIIDAAGARTTVIVTSDHGTGDRGHHGSGEPEARRTPLVLLGPGIRRAGSFEAQQLDIAPTMAVLLGLPIPAPVEGRPLTEELDVTPEEAQHIEQASLRQAQDYVDQYAAHWRIPVPRFTAPGQLGPWLERVRSGSGIAPLLLSLGLALCALVLFFSGATRAPDGNRVTETRRGTWCGLALTGVCLSVLEVVVGWWRLHSRAVDIAVHHLLGTVGQAGGVVPWAIAIVVGLAATQPLKRFDMRSRVGAAALLFCLSALGDSLVIPTAVGVLIAAVGVIGSRRAQLGCAFVLVLGEVLTLIAQHVPLAPLGVLASLTPLFIAAVVLPLLRGRERVQSAVRLGVVAAVASGLKAGFLSERWIHPFIGLTVALVVLHGAIGTTRPRLLTLGGVGLVSLALLTEPSQAIGLVAFAACLSIAAATFAQPDESQKSVLLLVLALVGARLLFVHIFEGEFSFSRLEINLGYLANPGQDHALGAATIVVKLFLPMFASLALLLSGCSAALRVKVVLGAIAFFSLRIFHIALSMVIARGTFYSPYADAGHLLFHVLFLLSLLILLITDRLGWRCCQILRRSRAQPTVDGTSR